METGPGMPMLAVRFEDPELGFCVVDRHGTVVEANTRAVTLGVVTGRRFVDLLDPADVTTVLPLLAATRQVRCVVRLGGARLSLSLAGLAGDGHRVIRLLGAPGTAPLPTGRAIVVAALRQALDQLGGEGRAVALLVADLDRFRAVNDALGRPAGDEVLDSVTDRLRSMLPPPHLVVRLGGDEFAVVAPALGAPTEAAELAERIRRSLDHPVRIAGAEVAVAISIGVAVADDPGRTPEELLREADAAMFAAKTAGRNRVAVADGGRRSVGDGSGLEGELARAIDEGGLLLHYQPEVSFRTGRVLSVEALVRWQHPRRGLLGPAAFVPVAEQNGLIVPLGTWVLEEACRQAAVWRQRAGADVPVRVNLSAVQLTEPDVAARVAAALDRTGCPPNRLCLEVTETMLLGRPDEARRRLEELRDLGVRVAIDDFGTGYSSLSYLKDLPVELLKIDKSFVDGVHRGERDRAIVVAVAHLALALGMEVTAEGVEDFEQMFTLQRLGVERGQGFLFARALAADQVEELFDRDLLRALNAG